MAAELHDADFSLISRLGNALKMLTRCKKVFLETYKTNFKFWWRAFALFGNHWSR